MSAPLLDKDSVEAWCQSYANAFATYDAQAITKHWHFPATVLQGGRIFAFKDPQDFEKNVSNLNAFYKRQNVQSVTRKLLDVYIMSDDVVAIRVEDNMLDTDGETIVSWHAAYNLKRHKQGWLAIFAIADGETQGWLANGTPLGS